MKSKSPAIPPVAAPVPVPQADDPGLVDVKRQVAEDASQRQGFRASLLTPGGAKGVSGGDNAPKRRQLGFGSVASGNSGY